MAKGFTQKYGIDYDQTFAPVVKHTTLRMLLAIAQHNGWPVEGGDAVNAYCQAKVNEYLLMDFPPGYPGEIDEKLQLLQSIYGLKQSAYNWNDKCHVIATKLGYKQSLHDPCLYVKHTNGKITIMSVYVDDFDITAENQALVDAAFT